MERRRQKNRNRRLMLALLMLLISGIALTTATYAWFSANTIVTTEDINVKVTASSGISISADAVAYGKSIKYSDVVNFAKKVTNGDYSGTGISAPAKAIISNPEKLNPVTTVGQKGTGWEFYQGQLSEDSDEDVLLANSNLGSVFGTEDDGSRSDYTDGDYVAFDVYLRTSTSQDVKLSTNSRIGKIKLNASEYGNLEGVDAALRVGFQYLGSTSKTSQKDAYSINVINGEEPTDTQWSIWNPEPWAEHAESLTSVYYSGSDNEVDNGYYAGIAKTTGYVKHYYNALEATPDTAHFKKITDINVGGATHYIQSTQNAKGETVTPTDKLFTLQAGVNKVRVYIWLEGQDKDCVDSITLSDGLGLQLGFEVIK